MLKGKVFLDVIQEGCRAQRRQAQTFLLFRKYFRCTEDNVAENEVGVCLPEQISSNRLQSGPEALEPCLVHLLALMQI